MMLNKHIIDQQYMHILFVYYWRTCLTPTSVTRGFSSHTAAECLHSLLLIGCCDHMISENRLRESET